MHRQLEIIRSDNRFDAEKEANDRLEKLVNARVINAFWQYDARYDREIYVIFIEHEVVGG